MDILCFLKKPTLISSFSDHIFSESSALGIRKKFQFALYFYLFNPAQSYTKRRTKIEMPLIVFNLYIANA